jgi:hypothetical protein
VVPYGRLGRVDAEDALPRWRNVSSGSALGVNAALGGVCALAKTHESGETPKVGALPRLRVGIDQLE